MKNLFYTSLVLLCLNMNLFGQIVHDICEDPWEALLDVCDYYSYDTDFSLAQDETSNSTVDAPSCDPNGAIHDAWFKFDTDGLNAFEFLYVFGSDAIGLDFGIELTDACDGNILDCSIFTANSFGTIFYALPQVDSIWFRIWFVDNSFQDYGQFCFSNLIDFSIADLELKAEQKESTNQLNWHVNTSMDWTQISVEVFDVNQNAFKPLKTFHSDEYDFIEHDFNYIDKYPKKESTYRLSVIDKENNQHFSNTVFIENVNLSFEIKISNPSSDLLKIFTNRTSSNEIFEVRIMDFSGKTLLETELDQLDGEEINISHLISGLYLVQFINQKTSKSKLLKFSKL